MLDGIKKVPGLRPLWRVIKRTRKLYDRRFGAAQLHRALAGPPPHRIMIGSGRKREPGWIPTQMEYLDLLRPEHWQAFFPPDSIDALLAEHVWEHLTESEGRSAAATCYRYLRPGGYLRLAVPDGLHPDPTYHEWVRVGGKSPMQRANDHRVLYTYRTIRELLESCGFRVVLYEYFDESGRFHAADWDRAGGTIWRSRRFDPRNRGGNLVFTSIVLDARKDDLEVSS